MSTLPADPKLLFALLAMSCTTCNLSLYIRAILKGRTRPHVFSWFLWGLVMTVGSLAQMSGDGGYGAWPTGYSGAFCFVVAALSLKHGETRITRSDWLAFISALLAIPLWVLTKNPLTAVLIVSTIDAVGFYPTFRKSYHDPWREKFVTFFVGGVVATLTTLALKEYSLVTVFYPATLIATHFGLAGMLVLRRRYVQRVD